MYFRYLLDALLEQREVLHAIECPVCGFDEIYYINQDTKEQIGRACEQCNFVQKFEFEKNH